MKALLVFCLTVVCSSTFAQLQSLDAASTTVAGGGVVRFNNFAEMGSTGEKYSYSDIRGTCYWKEEWKPATVVLKGGKTHNLLKAKLNFYTNKIHFVNDQGVELVLENNVKKISFYNFGDTAKLATFYELSGFQSNGMNVFAQLLVDGKFRVYKRTEVELVKKQADPMLGRPDLKFSSNEIYYIQFGNEFKPIKGLSKNAVFSAVKPLDQDEAWLKANKNKLKNETDLILYFSHRNTTK